MRGFILREPAVAHVTVSCMCARGGLLQSLALMYVCIHEKTHVNTVAETDGHEMCVIWGLFKYFYMVYDLAVLHRQSAPTQQCYSKEIQSTSDWELVCFPLQPLGFWSRGRDDVFKASCRCFSRCLFSLSKTTRYLLIFLKFVQAVIPTIEYDYTRHFTM